ncbi:nuclear transport factor 2 family protein [Chitinophaga sp. CB10]|uniref:nuclear transport factor 2 family protein n=1 Tax=Chitinophaga sp. CB10 TaxID=1891659 RepID=UPI000ACCFA1F|nr:nuclear transport factor 2 family protein [Chitinophaga sp. CB10]
MEQQIIETIRHLFEGTDERNWTKVENTMADSLLLDYSSMTGNAATWLSPREITTAWAGVLPGFDKTHHQLLGFAVTINGDEAQAQYYGKADHFLGNDCWTVTGGYDTILLKKDNGWKITRQTFHFEKQYGNTALPAKAIDIVKNKQGRQNQA